MIKVGLDLDGVFANWNSAFLHELRSVTDRVLAHDNYIPDVWNWPAKLGYTREEVLKTWQKVDENPLWWAGLAPLPDADEALLKIWYLVANLKLNAVFLTQRGSPTAHWQSCRWLADRFVSSATPQVCICANDTAKGLMARALGLHLYIDDKPENLVEVKRYSPETRLVLFAAPWNEGAGTQIAETVGALVCRGLPEFLRYLEQLIEDYEQPQRKDVP